MKRSFFPDTITLFNRAKGDGGKDIWRRTILDRCYWKVETVKSATSDNAAAISSSVSIRIMQRPDYNPPDKWDANRTGFTLKVGDLVLLGAHSVEVTGTGDGTMPAVKAKHGGIEIKTVHISDKPFMKNQHYRVLGV